MSAEFYDCTRCGATFGIAGVSTGSADDLAADEYYDEQVRWHESGECSTVRPAGDYALAARRLIAQPHAWLKVNGFDTPGRAREFARHIEQGRFAGFHEIAADLAVDVRGCDIWACYRGTATLPKAVAS